MFVVTLPPGRAGAGDAFAREAAAAGADVLEVRADLTPEPALSTRALPLLFSPRGRPSRWARGRTFDWIDLERGESSTLEARRRIASFHDGDRTPPADELIAVGRELRASGAHAVKIATHVAEPGDLGVLEDVRDALRGEGPVTVHAMGPLAALERIRSPWTNAATYTFVRGGAPAAPGQLPLDTYQRVAGPSPPRLFGILGGPGLVTASPSIHEALYERHRLRAHFLALPCSDASAAFAAARRFGVEGLAVTAPHKRTVAGLLDRLDPLARALGSVNTCIRGDAGWTGRQLDVAGLLRGYPWLADVRSAAVVGSGGVTPAVLHALRESGVFEITVLARDAGRRAELAHTFGARHAPLEALGAANVDLVVWALNADREDLGIPRAPGAGFLLDLRYGDAARLGERAAAAGRRHEDGLPMLVEQALAQFEAFTGMACTGEDREAALAALRGGDDGE